MVVNSCVLDEYSNLTVGCSRSSTCISVYFIILYSFDFFNRSYLYFFHFSILFNIEIVFIYLLNLRSFCYWNFKNKFDFFPEGRGGTTWPYHPPPQKKIRACLTTDILLSVCSKHHQDLSNVSITIWDSPHTHTLIVIKMGRSCIDICTIAVLPFYLHMYMYY